MKVIFLDVDGVLNCSSTKEMICGCKFVEDQKLEYLKEIVERTGAKLVLSSTWRFGWFQKDDNPNIQDEFYDGLVSKLQEHKLELFDKTPIINEERDEEIDAWLRRHPEVEAFVIIDDDTDINLHTDHLVKTRWYDTGSGGGLTRKHVNLAISILTRTNKNSNNEP